MMTAAAVMPATMTMAAVPDLNDGVVLRGRQRRHAEPCRCG